MIKDVPRKKPWESWLQKALPSLMLMIFLGQTIAQERQVRIAGKVTDETNVGMPGVNVVEKGTTNGTTTDVNGDYAITATSDQAVLIFSFIGYATQEVAVGGQSTLNVALAISAETLSEIVVVGYGTQKKSDVTGALVRVTEESLRDVPVANITQALQGRAAGVDLNMTSTRPGAGAQIRVRGSRSLTGGNDPLIVVDGIPFNGTINDINPSDIVSLDVLKDASSTAIYGSRGSNGVIIVTTKRGKKGKTQLSYDGYYGVTSPVTKYKLYNGTEFDAFRKESNLAGSSYAPTADEVANLAAGKETDWQDLMYKDGYITNHSIGTSGGTDDTQYSISVGYFKQTTTMPGQDFARYSVNAVVDQNIGNRIKIGLNTINSYNITNGENVNPMFQILTLSPLYSAYNTDGTIYELPATGSIDSPTRNPLLLYRKDSWAQQRKRLRTFNSLYGEVKILESLKYRLNIGLDLFQDNYGQYLGSNTPFLNGGQNTAQVTNSNNWSYTIENLLLYEKTFADVHRINFTGLYSVQEVEGYGSVVNAQSLPADYLLYYNLGVGNTTSAGNGNYSKSGIASYMGRINYSFSDKYLLTFTARADGSSRLAPGNQWYTYPAAAAGWNLSKEGFMSGVTPISNLKLRVGWGTVASQGIAPYSSLGSLGGFDGKTAEPYNYGSTGAYGYLVTLLPNPVLSWEKTTTTNLGLDFGLFANRISGAFEIYKQQTNDILQNVSLPATSGVGSVTQNIGKSENKGLELSLSTVNVESKSGLNWTTDFNFFLNRGEITYLAGGVQRNEANGWFVGHPIDVIFDYQKIGIWQSGETLPTGFKAGDIKIQDQPTVDTDSDNIPDQVDGAITAADRVILGATQPKWQGGLTNRLTFQGFDFSFVLFWKVGGMIVSNLYQANISNPINSLEGRRNGPKVNYWTASNPSNDFPRPGTGQVPAYGSTIGYYDAGFMKVRSINIGYNLPKSLLVKAGITSVHIYIQAQNPFKAFFSDYVKMGGVDPETNGFGGSATPGWGNRLTVSPNTPPTKGFIFGLNIKY